MNLFINAVTQSGMLILFDDTRQIQFKKKIEILGNESSKLIIKIDTFLKEHNTVYNDLKNIVVVNGPGSFTGVRTIVLAVNTINYIIQKNITQVSFFDLFIDYPIIKSSSRRDLFVKYKKNAKIEIVKNEDFLEGLKKENPSAIQTASFEKGSQDKKLGESGVIYGDISNNIISEKISVYGNIDYKKIIGKLEFQNNKIIEPLYIKKPNIS